jgi:hypothetical protein
LAARPGWPGRSLGTEKFGRHLGLGLLGVHDLAVVPFRLAFKPLEYFDIVLVHLGALRTGAVRFLAFGYCKELIFAGVRVHLKQVRRDCAARRLSALESVPERL